VAEGLQGGYAARQALSALMTLGNDFEQFRRICLADEDTVQVSKKKKFFRAAVSVIDNILLQWCITATRTTSK
jgi:hypothetical protein